MIINPVVKEGKSAYQYAVDGGYTGTEEEFRKLLGSGPWLSEPEADKRYIRPGGQYPGASYTRLGSFALGDDNIIVVCSGDQRADMRFDIQEENGFSLVRIGLVATPTENTDAVNKQYVDGLIGDIGAILDSINGEAA